MVLKKLNRSAPIVIRWPKFVDFLRHEVYRFYDFANNAWSSVASNEGAEILMLDLEMKIRKYFSKNCCSCQKVIIRKSQKANSVRGKKAADECLLTLEIDYGVPDHAKHEVRLFRRNREIFFGDLEVCK